jgi:alpha-beta hydrolase superfamily lysophospholipase
MSPKRPQPSHAVEWVPDILGPDYQATRLVLPPFGGVRAGGRLGGNVPGGTDVPADAAYQATLVRHRPAGYGTAVPLTRQPVLYIHGWSDYFYNTGLAEFFTSRGHPFYAVDLHNHGRSLGSPELGGYVADLSDYDAEIMAAHTVIAQESGGPHNSGGPGAAGRDHPVILMGHSTGGLTATLWAHHHPGLVSHLVLNSPWLEIQGGPAIRRAATPLVQLAELRPLMRMRVPERSFYWRGISSDAYGEWPVDKKLRPPRAFPVRAGWMKAILAAQQEVAAGLRLPMPILVMLSSRSMLGPVWSDAMLRADVVLDVRSLALRTLSLGNSVTLERIDDALHEVFLSSAPVRTHAYERLERWLRGYAD